MIFHVVTHLTLQLVGLLGTKDLWRVPDIATNTLHPVQVILVEHLLHDNSKKHKIIFSIMNRACGFLYDLLLANR